jgi:hypothetical protein
MKSSKTNIIKKIKWNKKISMKSSKTINIKKIKKHKKFKWNRERQNFWNIIIEIA